MTSNKKRVVLACQVFYPDAQSTAQLFTQLFEKLMAGGELDFRVICGYPSAIRIGQGAVPRKEEWHGMKIERCGMRVDVKRNMLSRLISYATFLLHTFWKLLRVPRGTLILGVTNPPFMGIILYMVTRFRRLDYQYYFLDLHPEGLYLSDIMKKGSLAGHIWEWFNGKAYRRADKLLILGDMAPLLQRQYHIDPSKLEYIPHWSVLEGGTPETFEGNALAKQLGIESKFVVQYSGNMGLWHDMETFVRAAAELKGEEEIRFLFIGAGRRKAAAKALADQLGASNIIWHDFVPKEQLNTSLACCHVSLVSLREGLEGIAVPCKIYGILSSARPMIAQVPAESEVGMVVREEECGILVKPGDAEGVVAAIRRLHADPALAEKMGRRAYEAYRAKYTIEDAVKAFEKLWALGEEPGLIPNSPVPLVS